MGLKILWHHEVELHDDCFVLKLLIIAIQNMLLLWKDSFKVLFCLYDISILEILL